MNWLSVYITVRVLTHSIILFWREPKLLRTACQTLQDSARLLHTKVGPCLFYPIFVPLSRMCFPLVCLEDSFSFPQILPAVTTFLFLFFFFFQSFPGGSFLPLCYIKHLVYFSYAFSPGLQSSLIYTFASPRGKGSVFKCLDISQA